MDENVCCPFLEVIDCTDTDEHKHLFCGSHYVIGDVVLDNERVKIFCLAKFKDCVYYPRGEE